MKNIRNFKFLFLMSAILLLAFSFSFSKSNAQTRTNKRKPTPKVTPTPVPTRTLPVVVSRANEYQQSNQQIINGNDQTQTQSPTETPQQPETLDDKLDRLTNRLKELNTRIKSLESTQKNDYEQKQKMLLLNLDILTRAEQRAETLRKQLFDLLEKENTVKNRLEQIDYDLRPEMIERQVALIGTLRPEEIREARRKSLENEKQNLQGLLNELQNSRTKLEENVQRADALVEKLRTKLETEIDSALSDEPKDQ